MSNYPDGAVFPTLREEARADRVEKMIDQDSDTLQLLQELIATIEDEAWSLKRHGLFGSAAQPRETVNKTFRESIKVRQATLTRATEALQAHRLQQIVKEYTDAWTVDDLDIELHPKEDFGSNALHKLYMRHMDGKHDEYYSLDD